ncbi:hypothetical protein [Staphylococcus shinii]|uniref:hypothetical protein n=1 Tax=Staphylococcus shinii TaxID=2912228 RepID=UPI003F543A4C
MYKTNLTKFEEIQEMMEKFNDLSVEYEKVLHSRYEYMSDYRNEYTKLLRTINDLKARLYKEIDNDEEVKEVKEGIIKAFEKQIRRYTELSKEEAYTDYQKEINALEYALNIVKKAKDKRFVEDAITELENSKVESNQMNDLLELIKRNDSEEEEKIKSIIMIINAAEEDYLSGFKAYREACENKEEVFEAFDDIFNLLINLGYEYEASILARGLPDLEEQRKERPDPEELLDVLKPIKSAGLEYWKSNRTNAFAYDYNIAFAREVSYTRRALLEDREYIGTKNAFERLNAAYDNLKGYMEEKYTQLGGTPYNHHGHLDRQKNK